MCLPSILQSWLSVLKLPNYIIVFYCISLEKENNFHF